MKKLMLVLMLMGMCFVLSGCYENTRRGYALDEVARHSGNVRKLENTLAELNPGRIVNMANITADTATATESWLTRAKKAALEQARKYDGNSER